MSRVADLRHVVSESPRLMVVDGSKLVRNLIGDALLRELPQAQVVGCSGLAEARAALAEAPAVSYTHLTLPTICSV